MTSGTQVPWYEQYFTADYWSYADAEYSTERTSAEVSYLAQVLDQHAPGRRVLDLACGVGRHSIGLARLGFELTGIDVSQYALDRAARAAQAAGVRVAWHRADVLADARWTDFVVPEAGHPQAGPPAFDAVICVQAFGWGRDTDQLRLLRSIRRLLAPGGLLVLDHSSTLGIAGIYAPHARGEIGGTSFTFSRNYDPESGRSAGQVLVERPDGTQAVLPDDIRMYTPAEIKALLIRAGFDVIRADADFSCEAPVAIGTRYVQFLATSAVAITPAYAGHRGEVGDRQVDLRWAPDEADFSRAAVTAAWATVTADPSDLSERARRYDVTDPYGGERAAGVLAAHLGWPTALDPDRVSVGAGVTGLLHGLAGLTDGGVVLIAPDGHPQLAETSAAAGGQVAVSPLTNLAAATAAIDEIRPAVTVIDRPSFTGPCWSVPMIAELAVVCDRAGSALIVDESYACYLRPGDSAGPLTDTVPGLVVLRGVSKGFCCGGLRIGFAISSPDLAARVREVLPPLAGAALMLDVALELLTPPDSFELLRARIAEVKPVIQAAVQRAGLTEVPADPQVPWIALRTDQAARARLASGGLVVKEIPELGRPGSAGAGLARMSVPLSDQRVAAVCAALASAADLVAR
ncbi:MAG TPA: aminotransferase class I/II-fold pyridoxal phosphate-dependent enzyme [Streptosporangiaceae bacterium]|nr:aminotransferase class I/II-fold pyridoxal phosphate-dependent enzyme [Streptosporangiaceae bacterium]